MSNVWSSSFRAYPFSFLENARWALCSKRHWILLAVCSYDNSLSFLISKTVSSSIISSVAERLVSAFTTNASLFVSDSITSVGTRKASWRSSSRLRMYSRRTSWSTSFMHLMIWMVVHCRNSAISLACMFLLSLLSMKSASITLCSLLNCNLSAMKQIYSSALL